MMGSMFILFVIEMYLNAKTGGHSHGGPTGQSVIAAPAPAQQQVVRSANAPQRPPRPYAESVDFTSDDEFEEEKKMAQKMYDAKARQENPFGDADAMAPSQMPPWFVVFYEQYIRQRMEMMNMIKSVQPVNALPAYQDDKSQAVVSAESYFDEEGQTVDPQVYKKMSANITLLEGGILFHSIFVGMTISITVDGFIILLVAILFHQMFEGLGLGSRIAAVPYPKGSVRPWLLVFAFGTTAPIGQAIGLITRNTYDPNSAFGLIIVGVFNAM